MSRQSVSRLFWMVAGPVAVVVIAWAGWSAIGAAGASAAQPAAVSPADVRQRQLLETNLGKPGDAALGRLFRAINAAYFDGTLPAIPVRWEPRLAEVGQLAAETFTLDGMFGHIGGKAAILLNPRLQSDSKALERALCHEIVHAHLYAIGDPTTGHGAAFQSVLRRLSAEGAFTGIVTTEEEHAALRAWLKAESARLDAEHDAMARDGAEIERERRDLEHAIANVRPADQAAFNARLEAYNRRATEANERAARDRAAVAAFNQQAERYNLMVSYPDGAK